MPLLPRTSRETSSPVYRVFPKISQSVSTDQQEIKNMEYWKSRVVHPTGLDKAACPARKGKPMLHFRPQAPRVCADRQSTGVGNALKFAVDADTAANMRMIHTKTSDRADCRASLSVFDQISIGNPTSMPTPVMANAGIISRATVPRPRTTANATPWTAAIELKTIDAPSVAPTSHSSLWEIVGRMSKA